MILFQLQATLAENQDRSRQSEETTSCDAEKVTIQWWIIVDLP